MQRLNPRLWAQKIFQFFKKKSKANLLAGSLLLACACVACIPAIIHLVEGVNSLHYSLYSLDEYINVILFSLLMVLPSFILISVTYLMWEGHSLGWKLAVGVSVVALLLAAVNSAYLYFALPIWALSLLAIALQALLRKKEKQQRKDSPQVTENVVRLGLYLAVAICITVLLALLIFIVIIGSPFLKLSFFTSMNLNEENVARILWGLQPIGSIGGIGSCVIGSVLIVIFCELVAIPVGLGAAIYLAEYAQQSRLTSTLRFFIEVLAGAPSVVIGIIGYSIFTITLGWGYSLYSGAIALSFMALPWNIRIAEESIRAVPRSYREASFALGASRWQTARQIMLYAAMPSIITGVLLGIGVALGETLVLQMNTTGATLVGLPQYWWQIFKFHQQLPSLTVFVYLVPGSLYSNLGHSIPGGNNTHTIFLSYSLAMAAATVLITIYLALCIIALTLRNYLNKRMKGT